jgi:hypothetical protein
MGTMAGAEPAAVISGFTYGDASKMRANAYMGNLAISLGLHKRELCLRLWLGRLCLGFAGTDGSRKRYGI